VADYCGRGETIVIKRLGVLILVATLLVGCSPFESYPKQQTTTTTTTTCPAGTQLQSDGMCR
jgi:PBP1b-binding outer membrane lipoprotein LpoB